MKMRYWLMALMVSGGAVACSSDNGDGPGDDCAVGESCACTTNDDCPDPSLEECNVFLGVCEPKETDTDTDTTDEPIDGPDADVGDSGSDTSNPDASPDGGQDVSEDADPRIVEEGLCTNEEDLVALQDEEAVRTCAATCVEGQTLNNECFTSCFEGEGLSNGCAGCHASFLECLLDGCDDACAGGDFDACRACSDENVDPEACREELTDCAGAWRPLDQFDQCVDAADEAALLNGDPQAVGTSCVEDCGGDGCDGTACIENDLGVSNACAGCVNTAAHCWEDPSTVDACIEECGEGSDEEECASCTQSACIAFLETCGGVDLTTEPVIEDAIIHVVHLSPDMTAVVPYPADSSDALGETGVAFESIITYEVPPFESDIVFRGEGQPGDAEPAVVGDLAGQFSPESEHTLAIAGRLLDEPSSLTVLSRRHDGTEVESGVRWQFLNATSVFGVVNLVDPSAEEIIDGSVEFGGEGQVHDDEAGDFLLGIDSDGDGASDFNFDIGTIADGTDVTFWLTERPGEVPILVATFRNGSATVFTSVAP